MDGPITQPERRTLTPAVLASALFVVACAMVAITFVATRGGLQMPSAASGSAVAAASGHPSVAPTGGLPATGPTSAPTASPAAVVTSAPTLAPTPEPVESHATNPSPSPFDPLFALAPCPDQPGCYAYLIKRGDSLSSIASRYAIPVSTVLALNPQITDPSTIVVGQVLYLGRDPFARLEPCPDTISCWLYVVRPGDRLSTIAGRFGLSVEAILGANTSITDENTIYSGQVIRLQVPEG